MMTLRKSLLSTSMLALASLPLVMGGCNAKDKGEAAQISVEAAPLGLKSHNEKVFARHFEVAPRKVSDSDAQLALKAFSMQDEGLLNWEKKTGERGHYTYENLEAKSDEGTLTIGRAELIGVHTEGGEATFDRADFQNVKIISDDATFNVGAISVARPSPKLAQALMKALQSGEGVEDLDIDLDDGEDLTLGAISFNGIKLKSDEVNGTIEQLVWGMDEAFQKGDAKVGEINFSIKGEDDLTSTFTFEGGSVQGVNLAPYKDLSKKLNSAGLGQRMGLGSVLGQMNLMAKPYDEFFAGKGVLKNEFMSFVFEGFEGQAKEKGGVTTITQIGKPITFEFLSEPPTASGAQAYGMLKKLGFDKMSFKTSQTQILDTKKDVLTLKDGLVEMEDGFRLNFAYETEGLSAMIAAAEKAEAKSFDAGNYADNIQAVLDSLEPLKLRRLKLSLEDKSIVERGLKFASEASGQSPEMIKKQMKIGLMAAPLMAESDLEKSLIGELGDAFVEFIEGEGETLTISFNPPAPLSVNTLIEARSKNVDPAILGFSASVSE